MIVTGRPAAPGIAVGPVWRYEPGVTEAAGVVAGGDRNTPGADPRPILPSAPSEAARQLERLGEAVRDRGGEEEAAILDAQSLMATDPALLDAAMLRIESGDDPATAVRGAAAELAETLAGLDDPLLAARAADVRDVGDRIARILLGVVIVPPLEPAIAVADDLPPSVAAELPPGLLLGIALEGGTAVAHAAILARALGIPAVVGAAGLLGAVRPTDQGEPVVVGVDGSAGEVVVRPTAGERAMLETRAAAAAVRREQASRLRDRPAATADGSRVTLLANIGSPRDSAGALAAGAEGVGLLRTEFLFMERSRPPSEEEQVAAYAEIMAAFGPERPVVVRLADIGGDKAIPYLGLPAEANPFLGVRAIRLAYRSPNLLVSQLRAIARAGAAAGVVPHVMAPMVATADDVALFLSLRDIALAALAEERVPHADRLVCGIMVEVPSAAILAPDLARRVEFFSIGTNDLTQYLLAADRTNAALGHLQDALQPAVLRAIEGVVAGARESGISVAVCGELAGDPAGALVLVGLGVDELSADPNALDEVRVALAGATRAEMKELATAALAAESGVAVREMAAQLLSREPR